MKKVGNNHAENGQALIEFIIFLPLLITLYSVVGGYAGSINGSINQLKITRSYFYSRALNNSTLPGPSISGNYKTWSRFGMYFIGWKDYFLGGNTPVMPCYKVNIPFKGSTPDRCEDPYTATSSLYVRVGTAYGICGATYENRGGMTFLSDPIAVDGTSCIITK